MAQRGVTVQLVQCPDSLLVIAALTIYSGNGVLLKVSKQAHDRCRAVRSRCLQVCAGSTASQTLVADLAGCTRR